MALGVKTQLLILAATSIAVYVNTLGAWFTFDDNFAVITNGDVADPNKPWSALLHNDFWGQAILSAQSHKSYRPLTIIAFRLYRILGSTVLPRLGWQRASPPEVAQDDARGLDPFPFHLANVLLHAIVTCLVYRLAFVLCRARDGLFRQPASLPPPGVPPQPALVTPPARVEGTTPGLRSEDGRGSSAGSGKSVELRRRKSHGGGQQGQSLGVEPAPTDSSYNRISGPQLSTEEPCGTMSASSCDSHQLEAFLAAALFAVHPVHTEAVAGIVGHAEMLSCAFTIPALLLYCHAVNARNGGRQGAGEVLWGSRVRQWGCLCGAILLAWAGALAKEIGITIIGAMALYDVFLGPREDVTSEADRTIPAAVWKLLRSRKAVRLAALALALLVYVKLRSWVAGDQLVRIYRKVENPIPFAEPLAGRLTTGYLHARYARLLLLPLHLSADWSYPCIPYVERLSDARNLETLGLYAAVALVTLMSRPWAPPLEAAGLLRRSADGNRTALSFSAVHAGWWIVVTWGLMIGPFFPASNVLFYVGTFIGERLLYFPSIGFCLLLAYGICQLAGLRQPAPQPAQQHTGLRKPAPLPAQPDTGLHQPAPLPAQRQKGRMRWNRKRVKFRLALAVAAILIILYAARTWQRNFDWSDEERLFRAAQKVCWKSAKVQLNSGIMERRYKRWETALNHFRLARALEPTYCEPDYWIGITLVNQGTNPAEGVKELERAIGCKYVMLEALNALRNVYQALHEASPGEGQHLRAWANILLRPELHRPEEACDLLEQAALGLPNSPPHRDFRGIVQPCLEALARMPSQWAKVVACVKGRLSVMAVLAEHPPTSLEAKLATYAYISKHGRACRMQHSLSWVQEANGEPRRSSPAHMQLIHKVQRLDAEDPWLQCEWGEIMMAEGRQDGFVHLQAALMLFQQLVDGKKAGSQVPVAGMTVAGQVARDLSLGELEALLAATKARVVQGESLR